MESRLTQVRAILDGLVDNSIGEPDHDGKGRFWNLSRDEFVAGPIYNQTPITPGDADNSFLVRILAGNVVAPDGQSFAQMPLGGPYIGDGDLEFIKQWIRDGAPDNDREFRERYNR